MEFLDEGLQAAIIQKCIRSGKGLILLDYDGTLVSFSDDPSDAVPGSYLMNLLNGSGLQKNKLCIISGRSRKWLDECFGNINVDLIAEHGIYYKKHGAEWINEYVPEMQIIEDVGKIMVSYTELCPSSFIERKECSLVWHYRKVSNEDIDYLAEKLYRELKSYLADKPWNAFQGKKIVEVRTASVNKGHAIKWFLEPDAYGFILAIGDDYTDEDMFKCINPIPGGVTIKVGSGPSLAQYRLRTSQMVISFLKALADAGA